jgi:phytoene synthase
LLYAWCRYADDAIDRAENDNERQNNLRLLREQTIAAFAGKLASSDVEFSAIQTVAQDFRIPREYALDLIDGMQMDSDGFSPNTFAELERYAYCVAGTVGLMMTHIMGISDARALRHAVDLGIALQLTNIARDVKEDFGLGRVYFPADWLKEAGIPRNSLLEEEFRPALTLLTQRLLDTADRYYDSGNLGLEFLSWRAAIAVAAAQEIYSDIGRIVRSNGGFAFEQRAIVSPRRKIFLAFRAIARVILNRAFGHRNKPWKSIEINEVWRPV